MTRKLTVSPPERGQVTITTVAIITILLMLLGGAGAYLLLFTDFFDTLPILRGE